MSFNYNYNYIDEHFRILIKLRSLLSWCRAILDYRFYWRCLTGWKSCGWSWKNRLEVAKGSGQIGRSVFRIKLCWCFAESASNTSWVCRGFSEENYYSDILSVYWASHSCSIVLRSQCIIHFVAPLIPNSPCRFHYPTLSSSFSYTHTLIIIIICIKYVYCAYHKNNVGVYKSVNKTRLNRTYRNNCRKR